MDRLRLRIRVNRLCASAGAVHGESYLYVYIYMRVYTTSLISPNDDAIPSSRIIFLNRAYKVTDIRKFQFTRSSHLMASRFEICQDSFFNLDDNRPIFSLYPFRPNVWKVWFEIRVTLLPLSIYLCSMWISISFLKPTESFFLLSKANISIRFTCRNNILNWFAFQKTVKLIQRRTY